jgi:hypothetical protein
MVAMPGCTPRAGPAHCRSKQIAVGVSGDTGRCDILIQGVIRIVVTGNVMLFFALLMQAQPSPAPLRKIISDHLQDRADTPEAVKP